jgi:ubiquinone/menaquinone biosynthesis C-methylase UbiE
LVISKITQFLMANLWYSSKKFSFLPTLARMTDFSKRSNEPELMDDLTVDDDGLRQTLHELDVINQWLGGNDLTLQGVGRLLWQLPEERRHTTLRIADLGCGSGDMLRRIQRQFGQDFSLELVGIDANPAVIRYAREKSFYVPEVHLLTEDVFSEHFQAQTFDIILCTLFLHHFTHEQLVMLLNRFRQQAHIGLVINDLHRHWFAYHSIKWLTRFFSRSYMTRYDASLSVARAFSRKELRQCMDEAGWERYQIRWRWAFRWQLIAQQVTYP